MRSLRSKEFGRSDSEVGYAHVRRPVGQATIMAKLLRGGAFY